MSDDSAINNDIISNDLSFGKGIGYGGFISDQNKKP